MPARVGRLEQSAAAVEDQARSCAGTAARNGVIHSSQVVDAVHGEEGMILPVLCYIDADIRHSHARFCGAAINRTTMVATIKRMALWSVVNNRRIQQQRVEECEHSYHSLQLRTANGFALQPYWELKF
eukprot:scaffold269281_cov19-Tisochrysis_lutea.AAC.1